MAELPGNDFMVTVGSWSSDRYAIGCIADENAALCGKRHLEASTLMHEMGHTLGLGHGGIDHVNCKPNYLSVMSYTRQFAKMVPGRPLDYSGRALPALDETALEELAGIAGDLGSSTAFGRRGIAATGPGEGPIDWDGDTVWTTRTRCPPTLTASRGWGV